MKITFLGHAGFYIETSKSIIIMDPWVSENGAFDGGWFQYPRNHHMSDFIKDRLIENNAQKEVFIYVSHEHKDHFDVPFLKDLEKFEFKYIIPSFRRTLLADQIKAFSKKEVILCKDQTYVNINLEERVKIFTDDSELNRDSAILFMSGGKKFLNMNDCKIHDRLGSIKKTEGKIDVLALQFSGATWHPTCYEYTDKEYTRISKKKKLSKFEATALAIENLEPSAYIPSAGPACFLDPDIIHLNFQEHNIFPRDSQVVDYLNRRLRRFKPQICQMMPGDKLNINDTITLVEGSEKKITDENFREYIPLLTHVGNMSTSARLQRCPHTCPDSVLKPC